MKRKVALISGGNRGLGWEVCRQLAQQDIDVVMGCRSLALGVKAAKQIRDRYGVDVTPCQLDVLDPLSVKKAAAFILKRFGRLDILVNNAAVFLEVSISEEGVGMNSIFKVKPETVVETLETNTLGPMRLAQAFIPGMRKRNYGRVVNVSSGDAQLPDMRGGRPAYRISKLALNAVTRIFASELGEANVLVNSVCPGWMKTRKGGPLAKRTAEKGAETVVWLATLPDGGPQGGFFRDLQPFPW